MKTRAKSVAAPAAPKPKDSVKTNGKAKPKAKRGRQSPAVAQPNRVAVAEAKVHFSRYVRHVQTHGRRITITLHGRDVAVLAPVSTASDVAPLGVRPRLDHRSLDAMIKALGPLPDRSQPSEKEIEAALDVTRADRF